MLANILGAQAAESPELIASASTLVAMTVMHKHSVSLSLGQFVVLALPYALIHLAIAMVYVLCVVPLLA